MASGKGKKGAVNEPQKTDPFLAQNLDYQAPGRAVGLTVMLSLVAFTAAFMSYQSLQLDQATSPSSKTSEASEVIRVIRVIRKFCIARRSTLGVRFYSRRRIHHGQQSSARSDGL